MKKIKYLMPVVFSLASVGATIPVITSCGAAETPVESFEFEYSLAKKSDDDNTATITKFKGDETDIVIPKKVTYMGNEYNVVAIGNEAFANNTRIKSVKIYSDWRSVTDPYSRITFRWWTIGQSAFEGCTSLTSFELHGKADLKVGSYAFRDCNQLNQVIMGDNEISWYALVGCSNLRTIRANGEHYTSKSSGKEINGILYTLISEYRLVFGLPNVTIPETCKVMFRTFQYCDTITSFDVPSTVTKLEDSVFSDTKNLTSVTLHEGLNVIGSYTFSNSGITEIVIPESVNVLSNSAFRMCQSLKKITFSKHLPVWPNEWDDGIFTSGYSCAEYGELYCHDDSVDTIKQHCPQLLNWDFKSLDN